jgi:internalin A
VRVYSLDDADIWDIDARLSYAEYWKERYDKLSERPIGLLSGRDFTTFRRMVHFYDSVGEILATLADIVQPRSFEELKRYGFD